MNHQGAHLRIHQGAHFSIWEGMREGMREGLWERMRERIPEPLIGSDRSHHKWEGMHPLPHPLPIRSLSAL